MEPKLTFPCPLAGDQPKSEQHPPAGEGSAGAAALTKFRRRHVLDQILKRLHAAPGQWIRAFFWGCLFEKAYRCPARISHGFDPHVVQ